MDVEIKWRVRYENGESGSNIIHTEQEELIFYFNQYADDILKERKIGKLIGISANSGDEKWLFNFPDYNYLYFFGDIFSDGEYLYVIADSNQTYDSGFERGLYSFDLNGSYVKSVRPDQDLQITIKKNEVYTEECSDDLREKLQRKVRGAISAMAKQGDAVYCIVQSKTGIEVLCFHMTVN